MSIIIPPEIYEKIFSYVCDSKTYKNLRMSCRMFHAILNDIKKFDRSGNVEMIYVFQNNSIQILNREHEEIGYVKMTYPCMMHYSLQDKDTTREIIYGPREIIKTTTMKRHQLKITSHESYNIDTKKNSTRTETRYENPNFIGINPAPVPGLPIGPPPGCTIS